MILSLGGLGAGAACPNSGWADQRHSLGIIHCPGQLQRQQLLCQHCAGGNHRAGDGGPGFVTEHHSGHSSGIANGVAPGHSLPWGHTRRTRMPWPVFGTQRRGHGEHNSTQSCCWPSTTGQHPSPWDHFLSSTRSHNPNDSLPKSPRTLWSFCCHRNAD